MVANSRIVDSLENWKKEICDDLAIESIIYPNSDSFPVLVLRCALKSKAIDQSQKEVAI